MKLIAGLGNPGKDYAGNRHNIGFMAIDRIMDDYAFKRASQKFGGMAAEGTIGSEKAIAFKPMGYMNTSGVPVGEIARFYKIAPEDVIVIHDELDLPLGRLRVKQGGSHGGHNGLKSIDGHIGRDYWRVRLGISHPGDKEKVTGHVLSDFRKDERDAVEQILAETSRHLPLLLAGDEAGFMSRVAFTTTLPETKEL